MKKNLANQDKDTKAVEDTSGKDCYGMKTILKTSF